MQNAHESSLGQRPKENVRRGVGVRTRGESLAQPYFAECRALIARDANSLCVESALDGGGNVRRRSANGFRLVTTLAEGAQDRTELNRQDQSEYAVQFH